MIGAGVQQALMNYVLTDRCAKERLLDANVMRWAARGMFDNFLVEVRLKVGDG